MLLAHGVGTRTDLPVPVGLAAAAAGATVLISFAVLSLLWRRPRAVGAGRALPAAVTRVLDAPAVRCALRLVTASAATAVCLIGFFGPAGTADNLAPWALYITFWVGLVPASLLLGPVWRMLNPLRLLHAGVARLLRIDPATGTRPLPVVLGYWPAAVSLGVFAWFELVFPDRAEPVAAATFILGYTLVHTAAAVVYGRRWFDRGDGFEVYSTLLGAVAPLGRLPGGRIGLRRPLDGLARVALGPGLTAVVVVLIGSTAYDGLSRTLWWVATVPAGLLTASVALAGAVSLIGVIYLLGTYTVVATPGRDGVRRGAVVFAPMLAPIAAGYAIAHYFSLLVFDGQQTVILASDPLDTGADLLGATGAAIDYTVLGTTALAFVQLGAIVAGHLIAAVSSHDQAVRIFPAAAAVRSQYPMMAAMVALTVGAVGLVFAA